MSITAERGRLHAPWRASRGRRPAAPGRARRATPRDERRNLVRSRDPWCAMAVRFQSLVRTCGQNGSMETVLVVDDEPTIRDVVVQYLRREGYATLEAGDGDAARELLEREWPNLVVLDLMLPGMDGLALCRWIRERSELPVIMLTARGEEADRIVGLELGADDYVTKPFSPRELAARVRSVLRRSNADTPPRETIAFGEVALDGNSREARLADTPVQLTAKEFELLWFLASHPRHVFF